MFSSLGSIAKLGWKDLVWENCSLCSSWSSNPNWRSYVKKPQTSPTEFVFCGYQTKRLCIQEIELSQCSPCGGERQLCWAWAAISQDQNTEQNFSRRKDTSVLGPALHKTFHSLRQERHVPRADKQRRVPRAGSCPSGAGEGLLSGSWHWGNCLVSCLWSSAGGTASLILGGRSQWYCLCTSLTPLMHRFLTVPRLLTRQGKDGNMTGLVQPSQVKVAALQVGKKITEEEGRINEHKLSEMNPISDPTVQKHSSLVVAEMPSGSCSRKEFRHWHSSSCMQLFSVEP